MSNDNQETVADVVAEKEAEIARLEAALVASNDELALARSNSSAMYHRLNSENIRIFEMDREKIHGLRAENARLRAALKPVLECKVMSAMTAEIEPGKSEYCAAVIEKAQRIYSEGEERGGVDVFDVP